MTGDASGNTCKSARELFSMPIEISTADLIALVQELQVLEGARIDKFYQRDDEIIVHIYKPGDRKYRLLLAPGRAFLTRFKREMPERPPGFCMYLRKTLGGKVIERVEQYDFDRILRFHTDEDVIVAELFGQGNVIVTNKNDAVDGAMRPDDDRVEMDGQYDYPDPAGHPRDLDVEFLRGSPEEDIVVVLAADMGIGGRYAEEVCARAGVDKNAAVADLDAADVETVIGELHGLFERLETGDLEPRMYSDADGPVAATPVPFETYGEFEAEGFDSFSAALDTYYTEREKAEKRRRKREKYEEEAERLERRLQQQE
ncbi:MAG: NFACT family protein, partial [Candidatus Nanohaloarchaea archaeon]